MGATGADRAGSIAPTRIHPEDPKVLASHIAATAETFKNLPQDAQATAQKAIAQGTQIWGQVNQAATKLSEGGIDTSSAAAGLGGLLAIGTLIAGSVPASTASQTIGDALKLGAAGLALGSSIGTVFPGIGTVIGGAVGAVIGAIAGTIEGAVGRPKDPLPIYNQIVEALPMPHNPDGSPSTAGQNSTAADFLLWHCCINGVDVPKNNNFSELITGGLSHGAMSAYEIHRIRSRDKGQNAVNWYRAVSNVLWDRADPSKGILLADIGALSGQQVRAIISRFLDWVPRGRSTAGAFPGVNLNRDSKGQPYEPNSSEPQSPIFLPSANDQYGWWLCWKFWQMAIQGLETRDAYHFCLMQQHAMHVNNGPDPEPHLHYLIGHLAPKLPRITPAMLHIAQTTKAKPGVAAAASGRWHSRS